jgi:hypothetical protein
VKTIEFLKIYDVAYDLLNLCLDKDFEYSLTVIFEQGVYVDFDVKDDPVAVEVVNPSKKLKLFPKNLASSGMNGEIIVSRDLIRLRLEVPMSKMDEPRLIELEVSNDYGLLEGEFAFLVGKENVV